MCLIFIALKQHRDYKLIIAANRDEFYDRKTAPADFWADSPHVLGGRDLHAGGTWLGVTRKGRVSLITNYRDPQNINPNAPSRGALVSDYLTSDVHPQAYMQDLQPRSKIYNGFNLIVGDSDKLYYHSNYNPGVIEMSQGVYGLSNHLLDTPWPKVKTGKEQLSTLLTGVDLAPNELFKLLANEEIAPDIELPDTGVGLARERALSSRFIKSPGYGTRCSTVILIDHNSNVYFEERVFDLSTFAFTKHTFDFKLL